MIKQESVLDKYIASKLNEEQLAGALDIYHSSLILAGAGSGKTRVLTYKIANMMYQHHIYPSQILAVTFTNKAANEMKSRILQIGKDLAEDPEFSKIISHIDISATSLTWVGTFHSVFLKWLKIEIESYKSDYNASYNKNFGVYDDGESRAVIKKLIQSKKLEDQMSVDDVKSMISKLKNEGTSAQRYLKILQDYRQESMAEIYDLYSRQLVQSNMVDFDDLLLIPYLILKQNQDIRQKWQNKWKYILVDEAQDTNWIQFELMKMLSLDKPPKNINIQVYELDHDDIDDIYARYTDGHIAIIDKSSWNSEDIESYYLDTYFRDKLYIFLK